MQDITLIHQGDWTVLTEDLPILIEVMSIYPDVRANSAHSTLRVFGEKLVAENFFRSMKDNAGKFKVRK